MRPEYLAIIIALGLVIGFVLSWGLRRHAERKVVAKQRALRASTAETKTAPKAVEVRAAGSSTEAKEAKARKAALAAIEALDLPVGRERGLQLASIARRFLTDAYAIPAMSCTTAELNELLRRHDLSNEQWRAVIESLDAVRFGGPAAISELEKHLRAALLGSVRRSDNN